MSTPLPLSGSGGRWLLRALVYTALTAAVASSLGMPLVPTIAEEFGVSINAAQWMLTVNLLVGALATPIMGRLSDGSHVKGCFWEGSAFCSWGRSWRRSRRRSLSSSWAARCRASRMRSIR
nr:MFS transporter [Microbacterium sp. NIBRBAC000506063]